MPWPYKMALSMAVTAAAIALLALIITFAVASRHTALASCESRGLTYYPHPYGGFCIDRDGRLYGL